MNFSHFFLNMMLSLLMNQTCQKKVHSLSQVTMFFETIERGNQVEVVLIAIKEHWKCREIYNTTLEKNEVLAIEINSKQLNSILIASIYIPPTAKMNSKIFHSLLQMNNNCLIVGDLNAALYQKGSRKTNSKGKQLQDLLNEGIFNCVDDVMSTYERNDYEEKIDWILANQPLFSFITNVETHPPMGLLSGHKPITFELSIGAEQKPKSPRTSFNFKAANWTKYRIKLNQCLNKWNGNNSINTNLDIERYNDFLTECLTSATLEAVPISETIIKRYSPSEATRRLIATKHQAYRKWKKNNDENDKKDYYRAKILLSNSIRNDKRNNLQKLMSSLCQKKMYSASVWFTVRKFHNKRVKQSYPKSITYNDKIATTDNEKANLFAEYFQKEVYKEAPDETDFHSNITRLVQDIREKTKTETNRKKWKEITKAEVKRNIKQLKNSSAGPDNIHNRCLKNHTKVFIEHLTSLFNSVINMSYIPKMWKKANIILLLKPNKDKLQPSSYRPISLLSCMGKLLEKIVKHRLMDTLNQRNILPEHQAGFRPKKNTIYNIIRLERFAKEQIKQKRQAAVILFDIKAAFDSVWHDGLIYKLKDLRLPNYLVDYLIAFLDNRTASIELESVLSQSFNLNSGTPQGSPLSPLLYIIYTHDSMNGIPDHTEHGLFADDTALWSSSNTTSNLKSRLQQSADEFQKWCASWKLKLQPTKTELVHFSPHPRKKYKNPVAIEIENTKIKPLDSTRYLGIIIDKKLNWRTHLNHIENKIADRIGLLRFLSRSTQGSNDKTMLNIYKAIARTIITYGFPVLITASDKIWERFQILQNKAIRAALDLPQYTSVEYIHKLSKIPRIKQYATSLLQNAIEKSRINNEKTLGKLLIDISNEI